MGTWDVGPFDNDDAADWAYVLQDSNDLSVLEAAFSVEPGYLESPDGSLIVAAAEALTALRGGPSGSMTPETESWVDAHRALDTSPLVPLALQALDRVLGQESELRELWEENDEEFPNWEASVQDLRARLA